LRAILHEGSVDDDVIEKFIQSGMVAGALWHMWAPKFTPKIRQILKDLDKENYKKSSGNDPIHDQDTYITKELRAKLEEKDIYAETIIQCEGDGVFIPQGAIHQVLNINSCVKIAVDFISCQCVRNALETTNELRGLSSTHENREDKLQLKSHIYHTAKEIANGIIYQPFLKHSPVPQETDE
jgi:lysine-specific demethylase 3